MLTVALYLVAFLVGAFAGWHLTGRLRRSEWIALHHQALTRNIDTRWWWSKKRLRDAIGDSHELPYSANRLSIKSRIEEASGCSVELEVRAPGDLLVTPKRRKDWRKVWRVVKSMQERYFWAGEVISVRIPPSVGIEKWWRELKRKLWA